jgi:CHAT domain-containing protein
MIAGGSGLTGAKPAGVSLVGESCRSEQVQTDTGAEFAAAYNVYCGHWQQPSAHLLEAQASAAADLAALATASAWRNGLSQRIACDPPVATTILQGSRAALMQCRRLLGGWPHVALVADVGNHVFYADGVPASVPAMEAAMASATGLAAPAGRARSSAAELIAAALAARPFGSNDLDDYARLRQLGETANDAGDYAAAEQAFRGALAIQQRVLGPNDGALATSIMSVALQLSNQGKTLEADKLFTKAETLLKRHPDPLGEATLQLYMAEHDSNLGKTAEADTHAASAAHDFGAFVRLAQVSASSSGNAGLGNALFMGPEEERATVGLASSWWFLSYAAYRRADYAEASRLASRAVGLLRATRLQSAGVEPRAVRTIGLSAFGQKAFSRGNESLQQAADIFSNRQGNDPQAAVTLFLAGQNALATGDTGRSLAFFRKGAALARERQLKLPASLVDAYLAVLTQKAGDQATAIEGLAAMQLVEQSETAQVLAQALVRLSFTPGTTRDLLRSLQDSDVTIARLSAERDAEQAKPAGLADPKKLADLDTQLAKTHAARNEADAAAQAASPEYARLVQTGVSAESLQGQLRPHEALLSFQVGANATYALLIKAGSVRLVRIPVGADALLDRITALRKTIVPAEDTANLPGFDTEGAYALYQSLFGQLAPDVDGLEKLVVVPSGPLAMLPLDVLVTAPSPPVTGQDYSHVPFLLEKLSVSYTPSLRTFLIQRTKTAASAATDPYIGFGDFRPATPRQLAASFPPGQCSRDFEGLKDLPPLPGTRREISYVGEKVFHVPAADIVLGERFTKAAMTGMDLRRFRIVHLATHGLLPTDLACRPDSTIIVSPDPHAPDANSAFLGSNDVLALRLDADLVLLSACNTGNGGQNTGDSLSALARSFFFAGARGLLVSHWELSDRSAPLLAALTLAPGPAHMDTAEALRAAKHTLIHDVAARFGRDGVFFTHPFAWAGFVLVGDGAEKTAAPRSASLGSASLGSASLGSANLGTANRGTANRAVAGPG